METRKILVIEDNAELSSMMRSYLINNGYLVYQAFDGNSGLRLAKEIFPDLIILDLMLPGMDGSALLRLLRIDMAIPVIVASAKLAESDKLELLEIGADDYITKPFSLKELAARVNAQLRRYTKFNTMPRTLRHTGAVAIDSESYTASVLGKVLTLTAKEFKLLDFLTLNKNRIFSKEQIIDNVWGPEEYIDNNTVAVTVARLREKLALEGVHNIVTVWGVGYKWAE